MGAFSGATDFFGMPLSQLARRYRYAEDKWGSSETMVLYDWLIDITEGTIEKKTVTLTALDEEGSPAASWRCINAWPVKYTAPDFNGTSSEVAIETIELAHEGLTRTE